ncbi:MAG: metallophosphoesterase [candidate division WOR-3 bacterium]|nr:metallophosphoesterase [candidate division WOR-3 bacterium]
MRSSVLLVLKVLLLIFIGCEADLKEAFFHPDVEKRVKESFALAAPAPVPVGDTFEFAVFGDVHIGKAAGCYLEQFRCDVDSLGIEFFCVLGDITEHGRGVEYDSARNVLAAIAPFYPTIGNHDLYSASGWEDFKQTFGPATYAIQIGTRLKLIFFDTAEGEVGKTQFNWLKDVLADTSTTKLVFTHFPIYDGTIPGPFRLAANSERAKLMSLLVRNQVYAYCCGHIHGWRQTTVDGVQHLIVGTMSRALDFGSPGYLLFLVRGDSISWRFVSFDR